MIDLSRVSMHYRRGSPVLSDVTFQVARGEFVLLTGPSGAGKTSLLKLLYGAAVPSSGMVLVDGVNVPRLDAHGITRLRRRIGVVFQDFKLIESQTVFDNLALVPEAAGASGPDIRRRVRSALIKVGLQEYQFERVANLSGGEQQRVAVARALVNDPVLLLADEPTGNLDPDTAAQVLHHIGEANLQGTTVLLATHAENLMRDSRIRRLHIDGGRVVRETHRRAAGGR